MRTRGRSGVTGRSAALRTFGTCAAATASRRCAVRGAAGTSLPCTMRGQKRTVRLWLSWGSHKKGFKHALQCVCFLGGRGMLWDWSCV